MKTIMQKLNREELSNIKGGGATNGRLPVCPLRCRTTADCQRVPEANCYCDPVGGVNWGICAEF